MIVSLRSTPPFLFGFRSRGVRADILDRLIVRYCRFGVSYAGFFSVMRDQGKYGRVYRVYGTHFLPSTGDTHLMNDMSGFTQNIATSSFKSHS